MICKDVSKIKPGDKILEVDPKCDDPIKDGTKLMTGTVLFVEPKKILVAIAGEGWPIDTGDLHLYNLGSFWEGREAWWISPKYILSYDNGEPETVPEPSIIRKSECLFDLVLKESRQKSKEEDKSRPADSPFEFL